MKEWIKDIAIALVIAIVIIQFIKPTIVKQSSMEPNFYDRDYLFVSKQSYRFSEPKRGDVIVFHSSLLQENGEEKLLTEPAPAVKPPDSRTRSRPTQPDGQRTRPPHQPPNTRPARYARASRFGRLRGRPPTRQRTRPPHQPPNTRPARYARASRFGRLRGRPPTRQRTRLPHQPPNTRPARYARASRFGRLRGRLNLTKRT